MHTQQQHLFRKRCLPTQEIPEDKSCFQGQEISPQQDQIVSQLHTQCKHPLLEDQGPRNTQQNSYLKTNKRDKTETKGSTKVFTAEKDYTCVHTEQHLASVAQKIQDSPALIRPLKQPCFAQNQL